MHELACAMPAFIELSKSLSSNHDDINAATKESPAPVVSKTSTTSAGTSTIFTFSKIAIAPFLPRFTTTSGVNLARVTRVDSISLSPEA